MEQPETPQGFPEPAPAGEVPPANPPAEAPAVPRPQLPDPKGALPIPDHFRLPFHGKMATPTSVPSATQRRYNLDRVQKRRRRRAFLWGLLVGQIVILGLDLGGELLLRMHPQIKLQASIGIRSIVFLGMAAGAALMIAFVGLVSFGLGLKRLFGKKTAGGGGGGLIKTTLALGVSIAVIVGTAWFMIPAADWKPTLEFAKERGLKMWDASKAVFRRPVTK